MSWRIAILPYLEQHTLDSQFRQDEPWDSEHNKTLIPLTPKIYAILSDTTSPKGHMRVRMRDVWKAGSAIETLADGSSNTILVPESRKSVPWTKPDQIPFNDKKSFRVWETHYGADSPPLSLMVRYAGSATACA